MAQLQKQVNQGLLEYPRHPPYAAADAGNDAACKQLELIVRNAGWNSQLGWALGGMAAGVLCTLFALQVIPSRHGLTPAAAMTSADYPYTDASASTEPLLAAQAGQQRMASLVQDVQTLKSAVAGLQAGYLDVQVARDSSTGSDRDAQAVNAPDNASAALAAIEGLPAPAGTGTDTSAMVGAKPADQAAKSVTAPGRAAGQHAAWVVNLASLPSRDAAERMVAVAESNDIATSLHRITVEGKTFWRVQATGFDSFRQAKSSISSIEGKLGTKGAWVMERTD